MLDAIKASLIYRLFLTVIKQIENLINAVHQKMVKGSKQTLGWVENTRIFNQTKRLNTAVSHLQDTMRSAGEKSYIFGKLNSVSNGLNRLEVLLLLVPFNFLFIDYILRSVSFLRPLSTIWDELALIGIFLFIALRPLWKREDYHLKWNGIDWLVSLFILLGIGLLNYVSPELDIALEGFRAVYQHIFWYFIIRQLLTKDNRVYVLRSLTLLGFFLGYHALYQFITKVPMPGNWVDSTETIRTRAFSIIGSPNILGAIFVQIIPLVVVLAYTEKNKWFKAMALLATPAMVLGLLFTFARQAYLAIFGSVAFFFILFYPAIVKYLIILVGIVLAALPKVADRIFYLFTPAYFVKSARGGRVIRYLYAFEEWQKAPFLGNGLGRFGGAVATHHELTPFYVDSYYLKTLGEMGGVGLFSMIGLFIAVLVYAKRVIQNQLNKNNMLITSGLFVGIMGIFFQNTVENIFEVPMMIVLFWGFVALIQSYDTEVKKDMETTTHN